MLDNFRKKLVNFIPPKYIHELMVINNNTVNARVMDILGKIDVLDYILKDDFRTFSKLYERPEDKLDERSTLSLVTWAYTQDKDPNFEYLIDWIMNTHGNEVLRNASNPERVLYGRAQLAVTELLRREIGRLSNVYKDMLEKNKLQEFDSSITVE